MNFIVLVLLPGATSNLVEAVTSAMAQYDMSLEAKPYKYYWTADEINFLCKQWSLPSDNLEEFARQMHDLWEEENGIDDQGFYSITTANPIGEWDYWQLHDLQQDVWPVQAIPSNLDPDAIVTPDGVWHALPGYWNSPEDREDEVEEASVFFDRRGPRLPRGPTLVPSVNPSSYQQPGWWERV